MNGGRPPTWNLSAALACLASFGGCGHAPEPCDTCGGACTLEKVAPGPATHVTGGVDYEDPPPVGGDHDPCWATWGFHADEVADERWVHNLEHGGVAVLWNCPDGCDTDVLGIQGLVDQVRTLAIATPYAALPTRFAAVAWGVRLETDCFDRDAFLAFYQDNVDHGPESTASEPPSTCPP